MTDDLANYDSQLHQYIQQELTRQENHIELIASENFASERVLQAQGSVLTNKYAEGYPGRRYYGGCEYVDEVETLAQERAKKLFGADHANVQPHSGSQANAAAYMSILAPGDTVLGMDLTHGGHLTHGAGVNFSGKLYHFVHYGVDDGGWLDYARMAELAREHRPKLIVTGASAYSRVFDWQYFKEVADEVGAYVLADIAHVAGLVAAGTVSSPIGYADIVTTTTHKTLRGPRGGLILTKGNPQLAKKLNSAVFPGLQGGPLMHVIAAKAVAFKEAMESSFTEYQHQVVTNAQCMAERVIARGYNVVSGGTDTHLFLLDLSDKAITGKEAEVALGRAHLTVNKNTVPNEPRSPFVTSGLRIGTPAMTTRGFSDEQAKQVADWICDILDNPEDTNTMERVRQEVVELCASFPIYVDKAI
jgi:glycine hydroxymethyltransferase